MPQPAEEIYARARARPRPRDELGFLDWDAFPWVVRDGQVGARELQPPVAQDRARQGEDPAGCARCLHPDEGVVWRGERWLVAGNREERGGLLTLWLQPRAHLDLGDLDAGLAGEMGRLVSRLHDAMAALPHAGRVHVGRWGDGSAHLHLMLMVRPARLPQVIGSFAVEWDDILPPVPLEVWDREVAQVAAQLATVDGESTFRAHSD